jgi:hypothetical protein
MYNALLGLHIAAGSVALTSMWIPIFAPKGGLTHRRGGWIFVVAMGVLSATALPMAGCLLKHDVERGLRLAVIAAIAVNCVSNGVRVLRSKSRTAAQRHPWDLAIAFALLALGVGVAWHAVRSAAPALLGTASFGVAFAAVGLGYWFRAPASRSHWWFRHMFSMLVASLIAAIAFATNLTKLGIWPGSAVAASLIGGIGIPGIAIWMIYYGRRFRAMPALEGAPNRVGRSSGSCKSRDRGRRYGATRVEPPNAASLSPRARGGRSPPNAPATNSSPAPANDSQTSQTPAHS